MVNSKKIGRQRNRQNDQFALGKGAFASKVASFVATVASAMNAKIQPKSDDCEVVLHPIQGEVLNDRSLQAQTSSKKQ